MMGGYMGQVLDVDLSSGDIRNYPLPEKTLALYVGNKGLAARLLYDLLEPGVDPLCPDNVLIVTTAPMTGTGAPSTNRFNVTTKSPLTGAIADSNCGGNFGVYLKRAGYDALIIRGRASQPVYLDICDDDISIKDARELWGLDTEETQERFSKKTGMLVIGPAGENLVKYACIISEERVAGRAGVGAVMGSKNMKAVVAAGSKRPQVAYPEQYKAACSSWRKILRSHPATGKEMPVYGTAININRTNATHTLPTCNYQYGSFDDAERISGEVLADKYLIKNKGCFGCPIQCGRQVEVRGKAVKGPEYETLGMFGSNLMVSDLKAIFEWNYLADLLGIDTISLGGTLGFVMEAGEKGLLKTELSFGRSDNISRAIEDIAYRRGFGDEMAEGVRYLAEKYGGQEFAIHSKGLELAAYEPRGAVGHGLGYAVSNRGGCHLSGGYVIFFEANGPITVDPYTTVGKPGLVAFNQIALEAISTLGSCSFTAYVAAPKELLSLYSKSRLVSSIVNLTFTRGGNFIGKMLYSPKMLPDAFFNLSFPHIKAHALCTGSKFTAVDFFKLGQRVNNISRLFNVREGFTSADDSLPDRLTRELQRAEEPRSRVPLDEMLPTYYKLRGWTEEGVPTKRTLELLEIET